VITELTLALVGIAGFALNDDLGRAAVGFIAGAVLGALFWHLTGKVVDRDRRASRHRAGKGRPRTLTRRRQTKPVPAPAIETATEVMPRVPSVGHADWIGAASMRPGRPLVRSSR